MYGQHSRVQAASYFSALRAFHTSERCGTYNTQLAIEIQISYSATLKVEYLNYSKLMEKHVSDKEKPMILLQRSVKKLHFGSWEEKQAAASKGY
ncbi:hypothetical protein MTR_4g116385 [Medicago truncatula]|uniref:Uncharacterized protein n=1 Tax=Medicago truncatula TaxID=3880 RepID=A0A072UR43_MEDTR|nr:hypothetical protein MTR_4g116385 [Medicago truncatula]